MATGFVSWDSDHWPSCLKGKRPGHAQNWVLGTCCHGVFQIMFLE
jgi:hypothetical protein